MRALQPSKLQLYRNLDSVSTLAIVLLGVVVIAGLYLGREVLVPIALAALLSFVLAPPVRLLLRWYIARSIAVIVVALIAFAAIFGRWASVSTRGAWRCNRAFHFLGTKVGTILLLI